MLVMSKRNESKPKKRKAAEKQAQKLDNKTYEKELFRLHVELVKLQEWVVAEGERVVISSVEPFRGAERVLLSD